MFHRVSAVQCAPDLHLLVTFQSGEKKHYDVKPLLHRFPAFHRLKTERGLFQQVTVDLGGFGVSWDDEIDLSCDELWHGGSDLM